MKKVVLGLIMVFIVAMSGCMEKETPSEILNSTQLETLMLNSSVNLDSYTFQIDANQKMAFINDTDPNNTEIQNVKITSVGNGAVDFIARKLMMDNKITAVPEDDVKNETVQDSSSYFINDTMYFKTNNDENWTKIQIPNPDLMWTQQNILQNQANLINASTIEHVGYETVDGVECYKVSVTPKMETYASILSEQIGSAMPLMFMNMTKLFEETDMKWTSWITVEGGYLKKMDIQMKLTMDNDVMNIPVDVGGSFKIDMDLSSTTVYGDYNKPVDITLPKDALEAVSMDLMQPQLVVSNESA